MTIIKMYPLHRKGLLSVLLIILGESITLTNAVQFWSTYQTWSNQYGRGRFANQQSFADQSAGTSQNHQSHELKRQHLSKVFGGILTNQRQSTVIATTCSSANNESQECSASSSSTNNNKLHPRQLARASTRTCTNAMYNCCQTKAPSCIQLDNIRGGHLHHNHLDSSSTTAAATILTDAISSSSPTPYNIPLNIWKIIFQIFLTALNVACWLIPLKSQKIADNKLTLGLANAFSGGVFLTLAFGHLIPECVHGFEGMNEALPFMIVLGGYLLIFFVEKVAFDAHGLMHEAEHGHSHGRENGKAVKEEEGGQGLNVGRSAVILLGALAVHSILEMTALGLARSFGDSALLTLSIALHQVRLHQCICCLLQYKTHHHFLYFVQ
jgi:hypothetical protein